MFSILFGAFQAVLVSSPRSVPLQVVLAIYRLGRACREEPALPDAEELLHVVEDAEGAGAAVKAGTA